MLYKGIFSQFFVNAVTRAILSTRDLIGSSNTFTMTTQLAQHITVEVITAPAQLKAFLAVPHDIYADDPNWIAPLNFEQRQRFSPKNHFFQHARWKGWVAFRDGEAVGRITAQIDDLHLQQYDDGMGYFGMVEAVDDPAVFQVLFDAAETWLKEQGMQQVLDYRCAHSDAFYYNWLLRVEEEFQQPFEPTHEAMATLQLSRDLPVHQLAANLRRAFSGIVAGNVKEAGIRAVEEHGPFKLHGEQRLLDAMDRLLRAFVAQRRMKLSGEYTPCYELAV